MLKKNPFPFLTEDQEKQFELHLLQLTEDKKLNENQRQKSFLSRIIGKN